MTDGLQLPPTLVEKATAGKKDVRHYLQSVFLDLRHKGKAALVASNGVVLVATPVDRGQAECIGEGLLPTAALSEARKNGGILRKNSFTRPEGAFPFRWRRVVPKSTSRKYPPDFAVNAILLKQVQDALCAGSKFPGLNLWFPMDEDGTVSPNGPILCRAVNDKSGAFGLVMPMRDSGDPFDVPGKPKIA